MSGELAQKVQNEWGNSPFTSYSFGNPLLQRQDFNQCEKTFFLGVEFASNYSRHTYCSVNFSIYCRCQLPMVQKAALTFCQELLSFCVTSALGDDVTSSEPGKVVINTLQRCPKPAAVLNRQPALCLTSWHFLINPNNSNSLLSAIYAYVCACIHKRRLNGENFNSTKGF